MSGAARGERKRITIRDVATLAQVDVSLVSRVLNNHPKASAAPATRERIIEAARTLGYQPNVVARGLRTARTMTLGLMLPNLSNPMYAEIIRAAEKRAQERGYSVVFGTHFDGEEEATFARMLIQGRVDGLLAASGTLADGFLNRIADGGHGPVVMINRKVRGVRPSVTVDDAAGAALAMAHFAQLGHRRVAGLFGPSSIETTRRRRTGFIAAAKKAGVEVVSVDMPGVDAEAGVDAAEVIFAKHADVTGIFASTFGMGMGVQLAARRAGISIPEDVSLVSLHESELADFLSPPLTTVLLPVAEMAYRAVDLVVSIIEGGAPESVLIKTPPSLRLRESTAAPRKAKRLKFDRKSK
jgi:LacI family transcriptional regulator